MQKQMDPDAFADAMNRDLSQCCKRKKGSDSPKKRKIAATIDSDNESTDSNRNRQKKKKKSSAIDSDSDTASVDSERSSKRKRATIPPLVSKPPAAAVAAAAAAPKANNAVVAQTKAVSSITKNPNIQVKKVTAARKVTPQPVPQLHKSAEVASGSSSMAEAAEVDCTPDLFAFLVNKAYEQNVGSAADPTAENSVTSSTSVPAPVNSVTSDASPLVDVPGPASSRQYVRRVQHVRGQNDSAPVIHNYNG